MAVVDSCALMQASQPADAVPTLIDQGDNDPFLAGNHSRPYWRKPPARRPGR